MTTTRSLLAIFVAAGLFAQNPPNANKAQEEPVPVPAPIRVSVDVVVAPVTVLDHNGDYVDGLLPAQFHLFDNDKEQDIKVDVAFPPISMVIAVQANDKVESILPQIRKIGPMIRPLITGDGGESALLAFDSRIRLLQDFTPDGDKIEAALKKIQPGSSQNRMIDAVEEGVRMLRSRPPNRRRVLLLISETRDRSSEARVRETLITAQISNVSIYTVDISRVVTSIMSPADPGRPDNRPPAMTPVPSNSVATPNTVMQMTGSDGGSAQFIPLMIEIFKDAKSIFVKNPSDVFTRGTGGEQYGFMRQRGLEDALERIGSELHSQYMVSYNPNNKSEGGFHQIRVEIAGRRNLTAKTRPGYWLGAK
ncbi:MAG TPA: VWA domain-containing protein [Bryobacteraceae bacterium]|nr:VWA domain-containing protein [Bryobacteraceae bacterium]